MKDVSNVVADVNYGVASFLRWSKFISNSETSIIRIGVSSQNYHLLFEMNTLNGHGQARWHLFPQRQTPRFSYGWLRISGPPRYPTYDLVDCRVHCKSSAS